ncbi:putative secreted hydrolase [Sphingomonas zeicaulis]|uniref:lipocalin-like domain-containing protein n=1 Tax=Sphingomonas zeicaulis TaxID=1632740 RepID=UPI003D2121D6
MRRLAAIPIVAVASLAAAPAPLDYPAVRPGVILRFPRDHGAHPAFRTEWWYVTGWLKTATGERLGFQVTFFRTRPPVDRSNPSRFAATQLLFAHAGLSDPRVGALLHDERAARQGFGLARARTGDADVRLRDWRLHRMSDGRWGTAVRARDFSLALIFKPTQPALLQGAGGYSRKGPAIGDASHYYSIPHLRVAGEITRNGKPARVTGEAWLDREWSSNFLASDAQGWDWTGLNFDDGRALMAFRIRRRDGSTLWAGGSMRSPDGRVIVLAPGDVAFRTTGRWRSPATGAVYPVAQELAVRLPGGVSRFPLRPLFPAQELDGRRTGLPVYWEGAVQTRGGRGYLELTGYDRPLKM